jgi:hypothetical protein
MPGFNTLPATGGGGGQSNMTFVASIHMSTYNRSWAQGGTPGYYAMYSTNQENGYAYFVGATTTGVPLNRLANVSHSFTRIDVVAPVNDMVSLYKAKVKATTEFANALSAFASFPSVISSSGNFVLPNNALPLVNVMLVGGGGGSNGEHHGGGGGGGGGVVKLTAYQAVGTTSVTIGGQVNGQVTGNPTYFGNVYALGGGHGTHHGQTGGTGANGGGKGSHNTSGSPGVGIVQTASTGLGTTGSPVYIGGHAGGGNTGGSNHNLRGGGGGGAGGPGQDGSTGSGGNGGLAHNSDISGTNLSYAGGGRGAGHHGGSGSEQHTAGFSGYGFGGRAGGHSHNSGGGGDSPYRADQGVVVVRYYIP